MTTKAEQVWEAFWSKVAMPDEPGACWEWQGLRDRDSYGRWSDRRAHMVAWELTYGMRVPKGLEVLHACDNPSCVRPSHLSVGTRGDNRLDRVEREKLGLPRRATANVELPDVELPVPRVLDDEWVEDVRRRHGAGEFLRELAREYEVPVGTVLAAIRTG